jgi:hypothetical protein
MRMGGRRRRFSNGSRGCTKACSYSPALWRKIKGWRIDVLWRGKCAAELRAAQFMEL